MSSSRRSNCSHGTRTLDQGFGCDSDPDLSLPGINKTSWHEVKSKVERQVPRRGRSGRGKHHIRRTEIFTSLRRLLIRFPGPCHPAWPLLFVHGLLFPQLQHEDGCCVYVLKALFCFFFYYYISKRERGSLKAGFSLLLIHWFAFLSCAVWTLCAFVLNMWERNLQWRQKKRFIIWISGLSLMPCKLPTQIATRLH